jgi:site-specific recombinase XerD
VADHRRTASSSYYNYQELVDWFAQRDITFKNVNRATFTENIGYARLTCTVGDCTKSAITAMRTVFEFFISEE